MGICIPSDPGMLRVLDHPRYRHGVWRPGKAEVGAYHDVPRPECDGHGILPVAIVSIFAYHLSSRHYDDYGPVSKIYSCYMLILGSAGDSPWHFPGLADLSLGT